MSMRKHSHDKPIPVSEAHNGLYLNQFWYSYWLPLARYIDFSIFGVDPNSVRKMYNFPLKNEQYVFCSSHVIISKNP